MIIFVASREEEEKTGAIRDVPTLDTLSLSRVDDH